MTDELLEGGDHVYTYTTDGQVAMKLRDRSECLGRSQGLAEVLPLGAGKHLITGTVAKGATGLAIQLADGSEVFPSLVGGDALVYAYFEIETSGVPVAFDTTGVPVPEGCGAPS